MQNCRGPVMDGRGQRHLCSDNRTVRALSLVRKFCFLYIILFFQRRIDMIETHADVNKETCSMAHGSVEAAPAC